MASTNNSATASSSAAVGVALTGPSLGLATVQPMHSPTPSDTPNTSILPETNELPKPEEISNAFKVNVLDAEGKSHSFADLSRASPTVLNIFIRHFYCSACQAYVELLTKTFPPHLLYPSTPLTINIIGCGPHQLIMPYATTLQSHLPHYTSPDLSLQRALSIKDAKLNSTAGKGKYIQHMTTPKMVIKGIFSALRWHTGEWYKVGGGGPVNQAGGEFVFVDGECSWGHKMKTGMDHVDIDAIEEVLGAFGGEGGMEVRKGLRRDRRRGCELRTDEDEHVRKSMEERRNSVSGHRKSVSDKGKVPGSPLARS